MPSILRCFWLLGLVCFGGCGSPEIYKQETFPIDSPFQLPTTVPAGVACEGARRALLGEGYVIDSANAGAVKGRKAFRGSGDQTTVLEMNVVCTDRGAASTVFANAVQTIYTVKKSAQSASVGVSVLGSVSLPFLSSSDSMVKVGDATVNDKAFYQRFFVVVQHYLAQIAEGRPPGPKPSAPGPSTGPQAPNPSAAPAATPPAVHPGAAAPAGQPAPGPTPPALPAPEVPASRPAEPQVPKPSAAPGAAPTPAQPQPAAPSSKPQIGPPQAPAKLVPT
jgi:Uncharacterized protein conserved in bacteria (DUF2242)